MKKTLKKIAGDKKWQEVNKMAGKIRKWRKFKKMAGKSESGRNSRKWREYLKVAGNLNRPYGRSASSSRPRWGSPPSPRRSCPPWASWPLPPPKSLAEIRHFGWTAMSWTMSGDFQRICFYSKRGKGGGGRHHILSDLKGVFWCVRMCQICPESEYNEPASGQQRWQEISEG